MRTRRLFIIVAVVTALSFPNINYAQAPDLGTAANFVLFSTVGAVGNTGISQLTGNIGTNSGAISGFGNVNGVMHNADAATTQAVTDLQAAVDYLGALSPTSILGSVLGNGDTLYAGVDTVFAAASIVGLLTLDAQGDPDAVFIIKIGGALTTAASTSVNLINGALACNVFWITKGGAISLATTTTMRGNLIANPGAIALGADCILEGRALSTTGSVTVYGTLAHAPIGCGSPILTGPGFPDLACGACYAIFSGNGHVTNSGITHVTGDIGTNSGLVSGFNPLFVTGVIHSGPSPTTTQISSDLLRAYDYLDSLPYEIELLYPAQFGSNLVLTPHTYLMNAATVLTDTVYLNAQGNADAIFVIKINGALTTSTYAKVKLINGAQAKNVFWKVEGAVSINDYAVFCGNIICNNGAIILNTGVTLYGRAFTTAGTINTFAITASILPSECLCYVLPNQLLSFTGVCDKQYTVLKWSTATEINSSFFKVERSNEGINWQALGTVAGAGNSSYQKTYTFTDSVATKLISYYRLKQTDLSGNYKYGNVIVIKKCGADAVENLTLYPNPSDGKFDLLFRGDRPKVYSTEIFNSMGEKIYEAMGTQTKFDLSNKTGGVYFIHVHLHSKTLIRKIVVKNKLY